MRHEFKHGLDPIRISRTIENWNARIEVQQNYYERRSPFLELPEHQFASQFIVRIGFYRNTYERVKVVALTLAIYIFTLSLCFITDLGASLQIASAILIGLVGMQGLVFNSDVTRGSIVEYMFVSVYVLLPLCVWIGTGMVRARAELVVFPVISFEWPASETNADS